MILYNITVIVEDGLSDEWLSWMNESFIPTAMSSGLFQSSRLLRVLGSPNEGETFCLQFTCAELEAYNSFKDSYEKGLFEKLHGRFGNRLVSFNSLMELVN